MTEAWTRKVEVVGGGEMVNFWICKEDTSVSGLSNWKDGMPITCDGKDVGGAGIEESHGCPE